MNPEPGIHQNISMEEYRSWDAVSNSDLTAIMRSPAYCKYRRENPEEDTAAKRLGTAIHCALLEPHLLEALYALDPPCPEGQNARGWRNTNRYREQRDEIEEAGNILLTAEEWETCERIRENAQKSDFCRDLTSKTETTELSVVVIDPKYKFLRKIRPDVLIPEAAMVVDIKSTRTETPNGFARQVYNLGYYRGAPFYLDTLNLLEGAERYEHYVYLTFINTPPFELRPYTLDFDSIGLGRRDYQALLAEYARCHERNEWPALSKHIEEIRLPNFAFYTEEF